VCEANDIGNPSQVASRLGDDEKDALIINDAMGRPQRVTVVNEAGFYKQPALHVVALVRRGDPASDEAGDIEEFWLTRKQAI
jgi:hypothetical protein